MNLTKRRLMSVTVLTALAFLGTSGSAAVLVDDTWVDGSRAEQNLPSESAWFAAAASTLTSEPGSMTASIGSSSALWLTYFTEEGAPSELDYGETIEVTTAFTPNNASTTSTSRGLRVGLFNYAAGATRLAADGFSTSGANGAYVQGYLLEINFASPFGDVPLRLRKRTNTGSSDLMGSSAVYTSCTSGGGLAGDPGLVSGVSYTLQWTVARQGDEYNNWVTITCRISGTDLDISVTYDDYPGDFDGDPCFAFDAFAFRPAGATDVADALAFTRFAVDGPVGRRVAPWIVTDPADSVVTLGQAATFSVAAAGSSPLRYQWLFNEKTPVANGTNATLLLRNVLYSDAGAYSVVVFNDLGTNTSTAATLTVNPPDFTAPGAVLDDVWADAARDNAPVAADNSVWYASSSGSLVADYNYMLGTSISSSRLWVGYFTENPLTPVDLAVGRAIKVTVVFTPIDVATWADGATQRGLRIALLNYSDGATRLTGDGMSASGGNGKNVTGYMLNQNFYSTFIVDEPMQLMARTSLNSDNLMGTTADFTSLGSGPDGFLNAPGFVSDTEYTIEFSVTRTAADTVSVTTRICGGDLDISHSVTDSTYACRRFDAFAIRANRDVHAAREFRFTQFKVEVLEVPVEFRLTGIGRPDSDSVKLTWESVAQREYDVQSRESLSTGDWTTIATVTAESDSTTHTQNGLAGTNHRYYRIVNNP